MKKKTDKEGLHKLPTSYLARFIEFIGHVIWPRRIYGLENIDRSRPSVYTCNHGQTTGPITAVIYLPVPFRPWVNAHMFDRESTAKSMEKTFAKNMKFVGKKIKDRVCWWSAGIVCHIINSFEPIPVYKGHPKESEGTIEQSVKALSQGWNMLIFPEKPKEHYNEDSYKEFNTGFAAVGRAYYESTGKCLDFYPIWTDKKTHKFIIGKPLTFNPDNDPREEKRRISETLKERMFELKEVSRAKKKKN